MANYEQIFITFTEADKIRAVDKSAAGQRSLTSQVKKLISDFPEGNLIDSPTQKDRTKTITIKIPADEYWDIVIKSAKSKMKKAARNDILCL